MVSSRYVFILTTVLSHLIQKGVDKTGILPSNFFIISKSVDSRLGASKRSICFDTVNKHYAGMQHEYRGNFTKFFVASMKEPSRDDPCALRSSPNNSLARAGANTYCAHSITSSNKHYLGDLVPSSRPMGCSGSHGINLRAQSACLE